MKGLTSMDNITADLHMHTTYSDGRYTPEELCEKAISKNLDIIAITDHDTLGDPKTYQKLQETYRLNIIPGIEVSSVYEEKSVHVLGYFNYANLPKKVFNKYTKELKKRRLKRMHEMLKRLEIHYDIAIDYKDVLNEANGMIARPHMARAILKKYPEYTMESLFNGPLSDTSNAYVKSAKLQTSEAIALIQNHGGIAVLAHPGIMSDAIHNTVLDLPFDGVEAYYPKHDQLFRTTYLADAKHKGRLVTAGSDDHGIKDDPMHGEMGDETLTGQELVQFLKALNAKKNR